MDKFDEAVKYFTDHPEEIYGAWNFPADHPYGYLFNQICGEHKCYMCPTQLKKAVVRGDKWDQIDLATFPSEVVTAATNGHIPTIGTDVKIEHLSAIAEVQKTDARLKQIKLIDKHI